MPVRLPPVILPSGGREQDNAATTQVVIQQLFGRTVATAPVHIIE
jgi:hypothetical protein